MMTLIDVDSVPVQVEGEGAQTLLMLHGWPDSLRLWDGTVAALSQHYRCARLTLPGYHADGSSQPLGLDAMTAFLRKVAMALKPDGRVTLVLHDWGCVFGYEFAARHPALVERIVAVDVGDHNSPALRRALSARARRMVFVYQFWLALAWKIGGALGDRMTRGMARALRCPTPAEAIASRMNFPYAMKWFGSLGGFGRAAPVEHAAPMLYAYGARKPFMFHSPGWLAALAARPGCAVQAFDTGHWVMQQRQEAFNSSLLAWLEQDRAPV